MKTNFIIYCLFFIYFINFGRTLRIEEFNQHQFNPNLLQIHADINYEQDDHSQSDDHIAEIPRKVLGGLKGFVANDKEISIRIHADKPLSRQSAEKVRGYLLKNEEFKDFTLNNLVANAKNPHCLDGLSKNNRDRLYKIIMHELDFSKIFLSETPKQQFTPQQIRRIIIRLKKDKQLCPYLQRCFGSTKK